MMRAVVADPREHVSPRSGTCGCNRVVGVPIVLLSWVLFYGSILWSVYDLGGSSVSLTA
jgi:hypothetical protein